MEFEKSVEIKIDQDVWIIRVRESLEMAEELDEEEKETSICVFNVPKELLGQKPEAYAPQSVSIGPYHHWRSELYVMERYKVAAARRFQKRIAGQKFESVVEEFAKFDWQMRSYYHKYLDYNEEALAWLMALDASFLLKCLQFYVKHGEKTFSEDSSKVKKLGKVLDPTGRSAIHNQTLKDLMMLENQIPLFLLQKLLEIQLGSQAVAEERLCDLVRRACIELSPFKFMLADNSTLRIKERGHILEVLYYSIVPLFSEEEFNGKGEEEEQQQPPSKGTTYIEEAFISIWNAINRKEEEEKQQPSQDTAYIAKAFIWLWKALCSLNVAVVERLSALPNLPIIQAFKGPLTVLFGSSTDIENAEKNEESEGVSGIEIPPTRDELTIPSVADLHSAGIKFLPTHGDLSTIRFDRTTATLYLPQLKLDANTEVILRNLVAFEASAAPGEMYLTRYTDFMNGIIDNEEDVRILRKSRIIYNHLESDAKVGSLWNGMGKCVKLTRLQHLDDVIADVNKYFKRPWTFVAVEYVKKYVFRGWRLLAMAIVLLLTCLQVFCSMYSCKRWFNETTFIE